MNLESIAASVPLTGEYRTVCPECSPLRKKSSRKELSVKRSNDLLLYSCFHCGAEGAYKTEKGFSMSASAVVSAVGSTVTVAVADPAVKVTILVAGVAAIPV
jgi:uncharacterized Zn finger protein